MLHSLTNVKISNKDFNWEKKEKRKKKWNTTLTVCEHMDSSQFVCGVCLVVCVVLFALYVFVLCLVSNGGCVSGFSTIDSS